MMALERKVPFMAERFEDEMVFDYAPFQVEAGKIKEFARAIGSRNPIYFDKDAAAAKGYRAIPAPPTFATVIDFWNDRDFYQLFQYLEIAPNDILHGEQEYEYIKTIYAGDVMKAQVIVKERFSKKSMNFFLLETVYKNQQDETVLINRSTLIERAAKSQ